MSLHPPSFFLAPRPVAKPATSDEKGPLSEATKSPAQDELAALRKENAALKQQVASGCVPPILAPPTPSAVLTSDLLQVEAHLQSKMRLLETERKELQSQVERGKLLLAENEERHITELTEIRLSHKASITKVQLERDGLFEELNSLRKESQERSSQLERQLASSQQECTVQVEELNSRIKQLEQDNAGLVSKLEHGNLTQNEVSSQLTKELASCRAEKQSLREEMEAQLKELKDELEVRCQQVVQLESYLGGEIPGEGVTRGQTWREEREGLINTLKEQESRIERVQSENQLINIRLSSLSEILSIQETEVAKQGEQCVQTDGDRVSLIKSLLTRWREKVFVLLLHQKLKQMEDAKTTRDNERERECLLDEVKRVEREKDKLSHTLNDRTAELQLQTSRSQDLQRELGIAHTVIQQLEAQLSIHNSLTIRLKVAAQEIEDQFNTHKAVFAQALTRVASLDQRLTFAARRLNSLAASFNCTLAMLHSRARPLPPTAECGCQTDSQTDTAEQTDLSSFSRERLEVEVRSLSTERDSLAAQLRESTQSFQTQLSELDTSCHSRLAVLDSALSEVRRDKASMDEELSELQTQYNEVEGERDCLRESVEKLTTELRGTQATLDTKVETAVQKQRQQSMSDLAEMEALVNVARREHAKAVVQLQQLQGQLDRNKDRAVEAVEMGKAKLELELEMCRKKLQATQVERNLLITTLRQEGIVLPVRQSPVQRHQEDQTNHESDDSSSSYTPSEHSTTTFTDKEPSHEHIPPCDGTTTEVASLESTDFRTVLKDLQMLSASLLGIETEETG